MRPTLLNVFAVCSVIVLGWVGLRSFRPHSPSTWRPEEPQLPTSSIPHPSIPEHPPNGLQIPAGSAAATPTEPQSTTWDGFMDLIRHPSHLIPMKLRRNLEQWWEKARDRPLAVLLLRLEEHESPEPLLVSLASLQPVVQVYVMTQSEEMGKLCSQLHIPTLRTVEARNGDLLAGLKALHSRAKIADRALFYGAVSAHTLLPDASGLISTLYGIAGDIQETRVSEQVILSSRSRKHQNFEAAVKLAQAAARAEHGGAAWQHVISEIDELPFAPASSTDLVLFSEQIFLTTPQSTPPPVQSVSSLLCAIHTSYPDAPIVEATSTLRVLEWGEGKSGLRGEDCDREAMLTTFEKDGHIVTTLKGKALQRLVQLNEAKEAAQRAAQKAASAAKAEENDDEEERDFEPEPGYELCDDDGEDCIPWGTPVPSMTQEDGKPLITLFSTFISKPKTDPAGLQKHLVQVNTMRALAFLRPTVQAVIFSDDPVIKEIGDQEGVEVVPEQGGNQYHTPFLKNMFQWVEKNKDTPVNGYLNGDILFSTDLIESIEAVLHAIADGRIHPRVLMIGQRTNFQEPFPLTEDSEWVLKDPDTAPEIIRQKYLRGVLFQEDAEDFFIITKGAFDWNKVPNFVVGRVAYDNALVDLAYHQGLDRVDLTKTVMAVHQTDQCGNKCGHESKPDYDYNKKLTRSWDHGLTSHANFETRRDSEGNVVIYAREKFHLAAAKAGRKKHVPSWWDWLQGTLRL